MYLGVAEKFTEPPRGQRSGAKIQSGFAIRFTSCPNACAMCGKRTARTALGENPIRFRNSFHELPQCVRDVRHAYREDTDVLGGWIEECAVPDMAGQWWLTDALRSYSEYLKLSNYKTVPTAQAFRRELEQAGYIVPKKDGKRIIRGLRKNPNADSPGPGCSPEDFTVEPEIRF